MTAGLALLALAAVAWAMIAELLRRAAVKGKEEAEAALEAEAGATEAIRKELDYAYSNLSRDPDDVRERLRDFFGGRGEDATPSRGAGD